MYPSTAQVVNPALTDMDSSRREESKMMQSQSFTMRPPFRSNEMSSPLQQMKTPRTPDQISPLGSSSSVSQSEYASNSYMSSSGFNDMDGRNPAIYSQSNDLGPQMPPGPRRYDVPPSTSEYQYYPHN